MKAIREFLGYMKENDTKRFFSWLISYSICVSGIVVLCQTVPLMGIITLAAYLWSMFALLNWMTK